MGTLEEAFEEGRRLLREATANKWSIHLSKIWYNLNRMKVQNIIIKREAMVIQINESLEELEEEKGCLQFLELEVDGDRRGNQYLLIFGQEEAVGNGRREWR